jgi:hypothetical protein
MPHNSLQVVALDLCDVGLRSVRSHSPCQLLLLPPLLLPLLLMQGI